MVFDKLILALVFGMGYQRVADHDCQLPPCAAAMHDRLGIGDALRLTAPAEKQVPAECVAERRALKTVCASWSHLWSHPSTFSCVRQHSKSMWQCRSRILTVFGELVSQLRKSEGRRFDPAPCHLHPEHGNRLATRKESHRHHLIRRTG